MSQNERFSRQWSPSSVPEDMEKPVPVMLSWVRIDVEGIPDGAHKPGLRGGWHMAKASEFESFPKASRPRRTSGLGYAAATLFATGTKRYQEAARQLREHGEALATERVKRAWLKLNRQEGQLQFSIPDAMADAYAAAGARLFYGLI